ncbi:26S proteasome non-ATPase regulatory subunit 8-like [Watersipora subatra]|uniref:26S proteasome non-ATPase regulatory subunit 8-like n=1 Tax=Watersipora subatra TaxID=2589382 RepID=UPI00355BAAB5
MAASTQSSSERTVHTKKLVDTYKQLTQEWNKEQSDLEKCGKILDTLKLDLIKINYLPMPETQVTKQELLISRDSLEIGAQWAIAKQDIPLFERYIAQLKPYYFDYSEDLPQSTYKFQLLGLNLLRLLAQNKLAEFHTELELLDAKDIHSNIYIKHPVSLEQHLMEGSYHKVFVARENVPARSYTFFMNILLDTIRDEIASCAEKAYERIAFNEAARILFFDSNKPMKIFAAQKGWVVTSDNHFVFKQKDHKVLEPINSLDLAQRAIDYARELEMII